MGIILKNIPQNFLSNDELSLLFWVVAQNEKAIAFDDSERGTYKNTYFPDYVMETIPHEPWRLPPIRIAESIKEEVTQMLRNQMDNGNLEVSTASYRSCIFTVQKPHGKGLRIVHDLQPLNAVSVQDAHPMYRSLQKPLWATPYMERWTCIPDTIKESFILIRDPSQPAKL